MSFKNKTFVLGVILCLSSCKTISHNKNSELSTWSKAENIEAARKAFTKVIQDCVPIVAGAVLGAGNLKLQSGGPASAVIAEFVQQIIDDPNPKFENSASLLRHYYDEKKHVFPTCGSESAEFVLTEFAVRTNAIAVAFGEETQFRIVK